MIDETGVRDKLVSSFKYTDIAGMIREIDLMSVQVRGWLDGEIEAVNSGRAGFSHVRDYGYALDVLDECSDRLGKLRGQI